MKRMVPRIMGTKTPAHAMAVALSPVCLSFFMSVARPASNMSMMTPISAILVMKSVSLTKPKTAGPIRTPAMISPTTSGAWSLRAMMPKAFALNKMIARSFKNENSSKIMLLL